MRLTSYTIGEVPLFDPGDKCIVVVTCSEKCKAKFLFEKNKPKSQDIKLKLKRRRRRKKK